jgi:hypothetical protein
LIAFDVSAGHVERIGTLSGQLQFINTGILVDSASTFAAGVTVGGLATTGFIDASGGPTVGIRALAGSGFWVYNTDNAAVMHTYWDKTTTPGYVMPVMELGGSGGVDGTLVAALQVRAGLTATGSIFAEGNKIGCYSAPGGGAAQITLCAADANHGSVATITTGSGTPLAILPFGAGLCFGTSPIQPQNGTWTIYDQGGGVLILRWFDANGGDHVKQLFP